MTTVDDTPEDLDVGDLLDELRERAAAATDQPEPLAAGTFVLYPMEDGGLMAVMAVVEGPMAGTKHMRMPPAMIRAASVLMGGGSKMGALKALRGKGKRRGE